MGIWKKKERRKTMSRQRFPAYFDFKILITALQPSRETTWFYKPSSNELQSQLRRGRQAVLIVEELSDVKPQLSIVFID